MGGHAEAMLGTTGPDVRLLGLDRDPEALRRAAERLARFADRVRLTHGNFRDIAEVAAAHDLACDPPGVDLLAVLEQDPRQLGLGQPVQQRGGRRARGGVEPHVERLVRLERESAPRFVDLP